MIALSKFCTQKFNVMISEQKTIDNNYVNRNMYIFMLLMQIHFKLELFQNKKQWQNIQYLVLQYKVRTPSLYEGGIDLP